MFRMNGIAFGKDNSETNFAWAVYAGLSYKVNPSLTIDLSYRYTDIGDTRSGNIATYDLDGDLGRLRDRRHHLQRSHARRALDLGSQPAPMPVAFK